MHPSELGLLLENPRRGDVAAIATSLRANGQMKPIVVNKGTHTGRPYEVLAGNHTLKAIRNLAEQYPDDDRWQNVLVHIVDVDEDHAKRFVVADNHTSEKGANDVQALLKLLDSLDDLDGTTYVEDDLASMRAMNAKLAEKEPSIDDLLAKDALGDGNPDEGSTMDDEKPAAAEDGDAPAQLETDESIHQSGALTEKFGTQPFTVIDTRQGDWVNRARAWKTLGIASELGRDSELLYSDPRTLYANWYQIRNAARDIEPEITDKEIVEKYESQLEPFKGGSGTSIFDPALVETLVTWFSAPGQHILDPWAGGSVRGVVSAALGRHYTGIDLRAEQVEANKDQWQDIAPKLNGALGSPAWLHGDARTRLAEVPQDAYDMVIGCPPYYDLEKYSDNPQDLSNLPTAAFDKEMAATLTSLAAALKDDTYLTFVVAPVRDKKGYLRDMKTMMITAAAQAGLGYVNDIVLVNPIGTKGLAAGRHFAGARTLARVHQDIVVFVKGDRKRAAKKLGAVDVQSLEDLGLAA